MRILDQDNSLPLNSIVLYLTPAEAQQANGYLEQMLAEPNPHHFHLNDDECQREITLTVHQSGDLDHYDERSRKLIVEEK